MRRTLPIGGPARLRSLPWPRTRCSPMHTRQISELLKNYRTLATCATTVTPW